MAATFETRKLNPSLRVGGISPGESRDRKWGGDGIASPPLLLRRNAIIPSLVRKYRTLLRMDQLYAGWQGWEFDLNWFMNELLGGPALGGGSGETFPIELRGPLKIQLFPIEVSGRSHEVVWCDRIWTIHRGCGNDLRGSGKEVFVFACVTILGGIILPTFFEVETGDLDYLMRKWWNWSVRVTIHH